MRTSLLTAVLVGSCTLGLVVCAPREDEVKYLPGLNKQPYFKHYSGYLNATGTRMLHYWFVESANSPATDPVVLWLNGGPGCSSLDGMLSEHGPFHVSEDGKSISLNKYAWNNVANVLYMEAPAGVGFSYSLDKNYTTDDDQVSMDNFIALHHFFVKFPEYKTNEFYVTGESYGGIYVPTLSLRLAEDLGSFNFKGFAVGNGLSSDFMNDNSLMSFLYYHGIVGEKLWRQLISTCCHGNETGCDIVSRTLVDPSCENLANSVLGVITMTGLNMYNLYAPCAPPPKNKLASRGAKARTDSLKHYFRLFRNKVGEVPPCIDVTGSTVYLNTKEVRQALHIPDQLPPWEICSGAVGGNYKRLYNNMTYQYQKILSMAHLRAMVYNGDVDMACNFLGDEWFVNSLNLPVVTERKAWFFTDLKYKVKQVAGFVKQYKQLSLVTVRGAGHMVPQDKPIQALEMFTNFIQNRPF
ncbi:lysosomal protective protein-like [Lingula anatina]|uniref:Carboxypeptidase n=1 Tax=Lingula anatina TaxID=7574 RepID=A0A2R2MPW0_LINAN|nr:lysosomal protective protein-like [Lingula anatina]|eukprot:XP_023932052.1 lysosomal protective protein-like [Lingula anatina]